jgi:hypothetical protein
MLITSGKIRIYNSSGEVAVADLPSTYVKPGEIKNIRSLINTALQPGEYKLQTIVYFSSGYAEKNSTINVAERPLIAKPAEKPKFPWWIIIIIMVMLLAYYWYKRD